MKLQQATEIIQLYNEIFDLPYFIMSDRYELLYALGTKEDHYPKIYEESAETVFTMAAGNLTPQIYADDYSLVWSACPIVQAEVLQYVIICGPSTFYQIGKSIQAAALQKKWEHQIRVCSWSEYKKMMSCLYYQLCGQKLDVTLFQLLDSRMFKVMDEASAGHQEEVFEPHSAYEVELAMRQLVAEGNVEGVKKFVRTTDEAEIGVLCPEDPVRDLKNHVIVTTSLATRAAIDGGLNSDAAYTISDLYIQSAERMKSAAELQLLIPRILLDFTSRVSRCVRHKSESVYVKRCSSYINGHLDEKLKVRDLAEQAGISPEHLSRLFTRETGMTIRDYIHKSRIKEARYLLKYTSYTIAEISSRLGYSSQSHFSSVFRESEQVSPARYRHMSR